MIQVLAMFYFGLNAIYTRDNVVFLTLLLYVAGSSRLPEKLAKFSLYYSLQK